VQIVGINARREAGWLIRMMLGIGARTFRRDMQIFLCETLGIASISVPLLKIGEN